MPYAPGTQFDPSLIYRGITSAGDSLGAGIADALKKKKEAEAQAAGSMIQFQTLKNAGLLSPEEETNFHNGNANKRAAIVTAATPRLLEKFKTDAEKRHEQQQQMQRDLQLKIAQMHYGVGPNDPSTMFTPDSETTKSMKEAGYTFARTSPRAGRWINTGGTKPDLDQNGNPIFSPDGSAFISGGKVRPLTPTMAEQRKAWLDKQEEAKKAAGPHWYDAFIPDALKSRPEPTPAPNPITPAPAVAPNQVAPDTTQGPKILDAATAKTLLDKAGGDKEQARALAKQLGYQF